jgi:hypothetical protein
MKERYTFCVFMLITTLLCRQYIIDSFTQFYRFQIEKTVNAKGVLSKAFLYEGVGTTEYQCDILYHHNGIAYNLSEDISYKSNMNYRKGDSIKMVYNEKHPQFATINNSETRYFSLFCSLFLVLSSLYSIWFLSKTIFLLIRRKNTHPVQP